MGDTAVFVGTRVPLDQGETNLPRKSSLPTQRPSVFLQDLVRMENEKLTKVYVDLPNHWATGGESMWAVDLGDDLYEIRNVPFYAYNLNVGDVVFATADSPDLKPEVRRVVRRSGHRTMRLFFASEESGRAPEQSEDDKTSRSRAVP